MKFTERVKRIFRGHNPEHFNVHHPEFSDKVEEAFKVNGIQYYRFIQELSMPVQRYMIMQTLLVAKDLGMDRDLLLGYIKNMQKAVNGAKGMIDLTTVIKTLGQMESRVSTAEIFEIDTTYALATIIYFDETEDLYGYDRNYNKKKADSWREAKVIDFFYTKPMDELLGLKNTSAQDLLTFIEAQEETARILNSETPG